MAFHALFGRSRELADLEAALARAFVGQGSVFLLSGEAGIGKTRLAEEVARSAEERGATVIWGRAWEVEGAPPCWPWVQMLRACLPIGEVAEFMAGDPVRVGSAIVALLHRLAERSPLVLVFDDLHASDLASLNLLQVVAHELRRLPVLVIGTYREIEARRIPSMSASLQKLARHGAVRPLGRLSQDAVAQWLLEALGEGRATSLGPVVFATTEGNPLFVDALAQVLASRGRDASLPAGFELPDSIRETVHEMLARLSQDTREVLDAASVLGRECSTSTLQLVCGKPAAQVLEAIQEGKAAGVIAAESPPSSPMRFAHVLIREGLYQELAPSRRAELHASAARALERMHAADLEEHIAEMAHHTFESAPLGSWLEAAETSDRAGVQAMNLFVFDAAIRHFGRALTALDNAQSGENAQRARLLWRLGASQIRAGQAQLGRETCDRAAAMAERLGEPEVHARAALAFGLEPMFAQIDARLVELLETSLRLGIEDPALRTQVVARLAPAMMPTNFRQRPLALAREAMATARTLGDRRVLAEVLSHARSTFGPPDDLDELLVLDREIAALAVELGDRALEFHAHIRLALIAMQQSDRDTMIHELGILRRLADETRVPQYRLRAAGVRLLWATLTEPPDAIARAEEDVQKLCEEVDDPSRLTVVEMNRFVRAEVRGDTSAMETASRALDALCAAHPALAKVPLLAARSLLRAQRPLTEERERDQARAQMLRIAPELDVTPKGNSMGPFLLLLVPLCIALGDPREMQAAYDALLPFSARNTLFVDQLVCIGPVAHHLGSLALALGQHEKAAIHFEQAIAMSERGGYADFAARSQRALDALEGIRSPSDRALPRSHVSARALSRLGMFVHGYRIDRILGIGGMATVYAATHPDGRRVAIKFVHESLRDNPHFLALFRREASVANQVGHPGAVPVLAHDVDEERGAFLIMPLLEGETVRARWERSNHRLTASEVAVIMADVLDVLASAHTNGIVHRDIKPENLFITQSGDVRVLDFGIARRTDGEGSVTLTGHMIGTPAFMSPEQALGARDAIGPHSDCWAAGATIFTLLSGEFVHPADNAQAQLAAAATRPARSLGEVMPELPASIVAFVDKALAFDAVDRWSSAGEMRTALLATFEEALERSLDALAKQTRADLAAEWSNLTTMRGRA